MLVLLEHTCHEKQGINVIVVFVSSSCQTAHFIAVVEKQHANVMLQVLFSISYK